MNVIDTMNRGLFIDNQTHLPQQMASGQMMTEGFIDPRTLAMNLSHRFNSIEMQKSQMSFDPSSGFRESQPSYNESTVAMSTSSGNFAIDLTKSSTIPQHQYPSAATFNQPKYVPQDVSQPTPEAISMHHQLMRQQSINQQQEYQIEPTINLPDIQQKPKNIIHEILPPAMLKIPTNRNRNRTKKFRLFNSYVARPFDDLLAEEPSTASDERYNVFREQMFKQIDAANEEQAKLRKQCTSTQPSNNEPTVEDSTKANQPKLDAYQEYRRKNNISAKKSRELRRLKMESIVERTAELEKENYELKFAIAWTRKEIDRRMNKRS